MNDPKYGIKGQALYHKTGNYLLPIDEPVMLLRGKDPIALAALKHYVCICKLTNNHHLESATERLRAFERFQREHPKRCGNNCDEPRA